MPVTKKVISFTISAALLASMAALTGCGEADNRNVRTNNTRYNAQNTQMDGMNRFGVKSNGMDGMRLNENANGNANGNGNRVGNLRVDRSLSNRISELPDVKSATVLVGERNAYVAVSLNDQGNGTGVGTPSVNGTERNRNVPSVNGVNGTRGNRTTDTTTPGMTDNGVTGNGTPARRDDGLFGTMGTGSYGMLRGLTDNNRTDNTNTTIEGARTAYEPSDEVKSRIANKVKQFAPSIEQVYVSANPDFIKQTTDFSRSVQNGRPIRGLSNEMVDVIERVFPTSAADTNRPTEGSTTAPTRPQNHTPAPLNHR
ncbi:hypothetical protein ASL14_17915 [Paenibacillus sp. IHB B 3084]|uniref:YhcN/YlaJ family sporulation lipoprotein n=1 Tax=Paenibacillus sp. IHB B 3084 TaxID=867076 RepID=UPI000721EACD|nr:YhcN/YlaJ family sporulation lipoprotein [Paenibacillus sp. IHB B 3084]ALP37788.1 hypothetical protein ASL14_17915 [Paenibacillus sp. IHB B 3084]